MDGLNLDDVEILIEDLDQSPWVDWGLWGEELPDDLQSLRVRAGDFENPESTYLQDKAPPETPAVQLQRALARFLGRY